MTYSSPHLSKMKSRTFLECLPFLLKITKEGFDVLKRDFTCTYILEDAFCSFHSYHEINTTSKRGLGRLITFDDNESGALTLRIILLTPLLISARVPALFIEIDKEIYFANHTLVAEMSMPKSVKTARKEPSVWVRWPTVQMCWAVQLQSNSDLNGTRASSLKQAVEQMNSTLRPLVLDLPAGSFRTPANDDLLRCNGSFANSQGADVSIQLGQQTPESSGARGRRDWTAAAPLDREARGVLHSPSASSLPGPLQGEASSRDRNHTVIGELDLSATIASRSTFLAAVQTLISEPFSEASVCQSILTRVTQHQQSSPDAETLHHADSTSGPAAKRRKGDPDDGTGVHIASLLTGSLISRDDAREMEAIYEDELAQHELRIRSILKDYRGQRQGAGSSMAGFQEALIHQLQEIKRCAENAAAVVSIPRSEK